MNIEIVDIARGHIVARVDGSLISFEGEALLRGHDSPDFVIFRNGFSVPAGLDRDLAREDILASLVSELAKMDISAEVE